MRLQAGRHRLLRAGSPGQLTWRTPLTSPRGDCGAAGGLVGAAGPHSSVILPLGPAAAQHVLLVMWRRGKSARKIEQGLCGPAETWHRAKAKVKGRESKPRPLPSGRSCEGVKTGRAENRSWYGNVARARSAPDCAICFKKPLFTRHQVWAACSYIPQIFTECLPAGTVQRALCVLEKQLGTKAEKSLPR